MQKVFFTGIAILLSMCALAQKQEPWDHIGTEDVVSRDSITQQGYTLIFISKVPDFSQEVKERMIRTFFRVYPVQAMQYNPATRKKVFFVIDPAYKGVAATSGGIVRYSPVWLAQHPGDIDVVTHEVMHIVQAYPPGSGPGWVTEGIADYVRYKLGVDNAGAGWSLPAFSPGQRYTDAYRVTARFLEWIEQRVHKGMVKELDAAMRSRSYEDALWKKLTGKSVDELWEDYAAAPALSGGMEAAQDKRQPGNKHGE